MPGQKAFTTINRVGIIAKHNIAKYKELVFEILDLLEAEGKTVYLDEFTAELKGVKKSYTRPQILKQTQLVIVLGGDGTLLTVARSLPKSVVHVLGINTGTLGFLTELEGERAISGLKRVLSGNYVVDKRILLRVTMYKDGQKVATHLALNDAVITHGAKSRLIHLPVEINQRQVNRYQADGLIIATPTGSTGHSLSAGGPIVHPKLEAFVVTPICPLSISNRPIILPSDRQIKITLDTFRDQHESVSLTIDGQICTPVEYQSEIKIRRSSRKLYLIRLTGENYYRKLRGKLSWG